MIRNAFFALVTAVGGVALFWGAAPLGSALSDETGSGQVQMVQQPSEEDDLWREMMDRARRNGGRLELDLNDPLGRKMFERMQQGGGFPFGPGFEDFDKMFEDSPGGPRAPFGRMPEEMRKMFDQLHRGGGLRPPSGPGLRPDFSRMLDGNRADHKPSEYEKSHSDEIQKYREVVDRARRSTVRVLRDSKQVALGTVVDSNGHILTKASQLGDEVSVQLADGESLPARVVGVHEPFDLALLNVEARDLTPAEWRRGETPPVGSLIATPGPGANALAVGVVSVAPRRPVESRGFLGIGHELTDEGVQVTQVVPGSAAASVDIQAGDIVRQVNDTPIDTAMKLMETVGNHQPGDEIRLLVERDGRQFTVQAVLGTRQMAGTRVQRFDFMNRMGSRLSTRRNGFPYVMQHDSVLAPEQCGGPLVDLSGRVIGVNIARVGRVASYAVPAEDVVALLPDLRSGKLARREPPESTKRDQLEEALRQTEAAEAEARRRASRLRDQIDRLEAE